MPESKLEFRFSKEAAFRFRCIQHDIHADKRTRRFGIIASQINDREITDEYYNQNMAVSVGSSSNKAFGSSYTLLPRTRKSIAERQRLKSSDNKIPDRLTFQNNLLEFDVFCNGNLIYSKAETGRFPLSEDIIKRIV